MTTKEPELPVILTSSPGFLCYEYCPPNVFQSFRTKRMMSHSSDVLRQHRPLHYQKSVLDAPLPSSSSTLLWLSTRIALTHSIRRRYRPTCRDDESPYGISSSTILVDSGSLFSNRPVLCYIFFHSDQFEINLFIYNVKVAKRHELLEKWVNKLSFNANQPIRIEIYKSI